MLMVEIYPNCIFDKVMAKERLIKVLVVDLIESGLLVYSTNQI